MTAPLLSGKAASGALFLAHAGALAAYAVPFPLVLSAKGLGWALPWVMAMGSAASLISPLIAGTLADKKIAPERLLAGITGLNAIFLGLAHVALACGWGAVPFFTFMACYQLCNAPAFPLITSIVMSQLSDPAKEFGPVRAWATWGWMLASFCMGSVFLLDESPLAGGVAAGIFIVECIFCCCLPPTVPRSSVAPRRWRDYLGLEALAQLRHRDHRTIFITTAVFSALLSPLYLYTTSHLKALGDAKPSTTMSLAQFCEGIAMLMLGWVLVKFRLRHVLAAAIFLGAMRYALLMWDVRPALVTSVALHGIVFVLYYPTVQVYLERRLDPSMRSQSQALLSLFNTGLGSLAGYLICGHWHTACSVGTVTDWPRFWAPFMVSSLVLGIGFLWAYQGAGTTSTMGEKPPST